MSSHSLPTSATAAWMFAVVAGCLLLGCTRGGPATHPVRGQIQTVGIDLKLLVGQTLELAAAQDPSLRASGVIGENGAFELESLHGGQIRPGAAPGAYQARIVLNDDDGAAYQRVARAIPSRYLQFERSGLAVQVPAADELTLEVKRR